MKKIQLIGLNLLIYILCSCSENKNKTNNSSINTPKKKTVSEILLDLKDKKNQDYLDLSHQNLDSLPDLSNYEVKELNISNNKLDTILLSHLPKNVQILKSSNNNIKSFGIFNGAVSLKIDSQFNNSRINLIEIDLSNNKLTNFNLTILDEKCNLKRLNLSNNLLNQIQINCKEVEYINISNNPNLSNIVDFDLDIDTIIRTNIKNDLPLERQYVKPLKEISCY